MDQSTTSLANTPNTPNTYFRSESLGDGDDAAVRADSGMSSLVEQQVLVGEPQSFVVSSQQSLPGPPEHTPVWGKTSCTSAAPAVSPTSAATMERTCS